MRLNEVIDVANRVSICLGPTEPTCNDATEKSWNGAAINRDGELRHEEFLLLVLLLLHSFYVHVRTMRV